VYKRILIPTDGSAVARKAVDAGVALAKSLGATIVGYHAVEPLEHIYVRGGASVRQATAGEIDRGLREAGERQLDEIRLAAKSAGVPCETVMTSPAEPYQGIVDTARAKRCDLVCIGSHGRGGVASVILGSVAQKVLSRSTIPVLVCR
jgi:nucleotide-binding universal stress UspA family protein